MATEKVSLLRIVPLALLSLPSKAGWVLVTVTVKSSSASTMVSSVVPTVMVRVAPVPEPAVKVTEPGVLS